jgi:Ca-activated chloride channel family protein
VFSSPQAAPLPGGRPRLPGALACLYIPAVRLASPLLRLLLTALPLLAWLVVRAEHVRRARLAQLADHALWSRVVRGEVPGRRARLQVLALAAVAVGVVAAAGPQFGERTVLLPRRGLDVLFVVDVSRSMRARDVLPDRLERVKAEIEALLPRLGEHRLGLVAFAGSAFVQCPLTSDPEALRLFLRALAPETVPQGGTALRAGLEVARNALLAEDEGLPTDAKRPGRVVVVITDGEDHEGGLEEAGKGLAALGASVLLIGVGSTLGEPIPVLDDTGRMQGYLQDRRGQTVLSRMSPEVLQAAATAVGGRFVDGSTRPDLGLSELEARVAALEKRELSDRTRVEYAHRASPLALLGAVLVASWLAWPERRRGPLPGLGTPSGSAP